MAGMFSLASVIISIFMETKNTVTLLAALAQDTCLAIYRLLVQQGTEGLAVGQIGERLAVANATLPFHLKELSHAGLGQARQEGRFIYYSANYEADERPAGLFD
ncbi:helix-turn-helix domain-containing protein [Chromobacterium violaceum]|uniref:ArsR/SmtB family transcription factor n=1 Tax=Chromobacterium violaceum TaxID=536 RepID=UPI001E5F29E3|nr:metalloregulator ArsR/SmtB family transcription factor [Chromobacterium violaceum]MCD0492018.1 helix-turn-helix domain-containing protein [Chromobacterium violaceum]